MDFHIIIECILHQTHITHIYSNVCKYCLGGAGT